MHRNKKIGNKLVSYIFFVLLNNSFSLKYEFNFYNTFMTVVVILIIKKWIKKHHNIHSSSLQMGKKANSKLWNYKEMFLVLFRKQMSPTVNQTSAE